MQLNTLFKHWSYRIIAPGTLLREKYEALKELLSYDICCHEEMAEFQDLLHDGHREDFARIRKRFSRFSAQVAGMIQALETMDPGTYSSLKSYHKKFDFYTRFLIASPAINFGPPYVLALEDISIDDKEIGNKAKHLAVLKHTLNNSVPNGFAISTSGYHYFIEYNNLRQTIEAQLAGLDINDTESLNITSQKLIKIVTEAELPPDIEQAIYNAYDIWNLPGQESIKIAVRSSAISEDGEYSFAGQYSTVLNVDRPDIGAAYKDVLASKYSPEALFYRISQGLGDEETAMSVLVQEMVAAASSGVLYTTGITDNAQDQANLHLHITRGLGEQLVSGAVNPDYYVITRTEPHTIVSKQTLSPIINDEQARLLAMQGMIIEKYFDRPQDIEWAANEQGDIFILQARELHISNEVEAVDDDNQYRDKILLSGCEKASGGVAGGVIFRVDSIEDLDKVPEGAVIVTKDSPPDFVKIIKKISAVISERGSRASHFATVAREFGVPFLAGIDNARSKFEAGTVVTVDGNRGFIYEGLLQELIQKHIKPQGSGPYHRVLSEALKFITPLELTDPAGDNFTPEGCRSMHDIIRFCHEKALFSMFTTGKPGTGRGSLRLDADIPLDVFLFDVGEGISTETPKGQSVPLESVVSTPFKALWKGLSHPDVQWKQKPFDWDAYDKIELAGGVPPKKDSFAFASYAVVSPDYLHFNLRFGYHFTIVDVLCGDNQAENHCLLRFAGGGGDYDQLSLRIDFLSGVLERLDFTVDKKGDLLEAKLHGFSKEVMEQKLDMLGRLLGASKLMDMVLKGDEMVATCVDEFYDGRYSFSQEG
ncbi:MAG: pyruvate,water dikinase [Desulforhopalus sp.]|jgi:pyruvate,water dikinase